MKKFIKSLVITTTLSSVLLASSVMAAQLKIGMINIQEVMGKIPQSAVVMQTLEAEFKDAQAELAKLEKDIKYYQEKQKRDGALMTEKEKTDLNKQIGTLYQEYQAKGQALKQRVGIRQNEEQGKLLALIHQAIDNIASTEKYDFILAEQAVLFSKPGTKITDKVVEQVSKLN